METIAYDHLLYGVLGNENNETFELSYATFAEELQLREILKESLILASENATAGEGEASSSSLPFPSPEPISSPGSSSGSDSGSGSGSSLEMEEIERAFNFKTEKQLLEDAVCEEAIKQSGSPVLSWGRPEAENFRARKPRGRRHYSRPNFNGRTSSREFHGTKMSWRGSGTGNTQDPIPKGKLGIALDDEYDNLNDDEDEFDSDDTSQMSHENRKKIKWFKEFFERMDALNNIEEVDETVWHCPACQGGPGAIKWYRSIQDLIGHAKKIGTRKVKLHRELAELLEVELNKGTSINAPAAAQTLGYWKGLKEDARDPEIVWPPMVVIRNTMTSIYKDGKRIGMGNQELLEHFRSYPVLKALHSYGPQGHRGLSVLIFESSAVGYLEAERLHKSFVVQGLDRLAWNSCQDMVLAGEERQLYGYMAMNEDLNIFNQHCQGKSKIKYEMKSYQEAVLNEIQKMSEDSQQLISLKDRFEEERKRAKTFEGSVDNLSRNLQQKMDDIHIFKRRVQLLHEQNQEEMDSQEKFYEDKIKILEEKVKELEKLGETYSSSVHTGEPAPAMVCND